jgi:DNA-binding FrmR family transcriptional regulator
LTKISLVAYNFNDRYPLGVLRGDGMQTEKKKRVISRLRRIEGQVRGVQRMIEEDADCGEILNQIAAIKSAVHHAGIILFETHAQECIAKALQEGDQEQSFEEMVRVMGRFIK